MPARGSLTRLKQKVSASLGRRRAASEPPAGPGDDAFAGTGGIDVAYRPRRNGRPDPGEVVWTWVPFEDDPSQGKDRPVLVLGLAGARLAVVPLSSKDHAQRRDAGEWIEVGRGTWDREFRISYANADRILRVEPTSVRREGAALDRAAFDRVVDRVAQLNDWSR